MNAFRTFTWAFALGLCTILSFVSMAKAGVNQTYIFKVFLEDEEIGEQRFVVSSNRDWTKVEIEAKFEVRYWLFTAYTYTHTNEEMWNGECLYRIHSQTNDNGKTFFVEGSYVDNLLTLITHSGTQSLNGCIKTFSYWDRKFLSSKSLLNSQTGEMNGITVKELGKEVISVRSQPTPATHYQVFADKFSIDLWYSFGGEWVAMHATTKIDSKLRYVLQ